MWARDEFRRIAREHPDNLTVVAEHPLDADGELRFLIRLPTGDLPANPAGLRVGGTEDVIVAVGRGFPRVPPLASVDHLRFADCAHVLQGDRLCVYLDPDREWHPRAGIVGFLDALWGWFDDAVNGRFDPATALYHAVGGVLHRTPGSPTVVVRADLPEGADVRRAYLVQRSPHRLDLRWGAVSSAEIATLVVVPRRLTFGAQTTLGGLLASLVDADCSSARLLSAFAACARRNPASARQPFVLAVPNPVAGVYFLLAGRFDPPTTNVLRRRSAGQGPVITVDVSALDLEAPIEWCAMSDERPEITTRRDAERPVKAFASKTVQVWGCGGLGSWIAEFIVRAGAAHVVLCDPASVAGGLLVRQNYTEGDVGTNKADALADRLRSLSDEVEITVVTDPVPELTSLAGCHVLVDATVHLGIGDLLDTYARQCVGPRPLLAAVATDSRSATLGILTVAGSDYRAGPSTIDRLTEPVVLTDQDLVRYRPLWQAPAPGEELIPARGCSTPTFHGSAADLAAVAGVLVSLLGADIEAASAGTHLVGLPHADVDGPAHRFVPAPEPG